MTKSIASLTVSCYVQCSAVNSCKHTNGRLKKKRWKFAYTKVTFIDISEQIYAWARWSLGVSKPINCHIIVFNMYNCDQIIPGIICGSFLAKNNFCHFWTGPYVIRPVPGNWKLGLCVANHFWESTVQSRGCPVI